LIGIPLDSLFYALSGDEGFAMILWFFI